MGEISLIQKLKRLDGLIRRESTGTAVELSAKLDVSRSSVYRLIDILKNNGAPVSYNRDKRSFYYENQGRFIISFKLD